MAHRTLRSASIPSFVLVLITGLLVQVVNSQASSSGGERFPSSPDGDSILFSNSSNVFRAAKAMVDTFYIYGGPGTLDGKFQTSTGEADRQGWIGNDVTTSTTPIWQVSPFNGPTGTSALWAGRSAAEEPGWQTAPGYGNNWNGVASFRAVVPDNSVSTTVQWSFTYNYDVEPGYDFFQAEAEVGGSIVVLLQESGTNKDGQGVFTPENANLSVTYDPGEYVGPNSDEIHLRFRFTSDQAWSDEDGMFPTDGAVQIDDVVVDIGAGGSFSDDFELGMGNWEQSTLAVVGDFSKVVTLVSDLDPCIDNWTPQMSFIDDGTPPNNAPGQSTGGETSPVFNYGVPGGYVVNHSGGLSGSAALHNEVISPEILWDDPATTLDDGLEGGLVLRYGIWAHLPFANNVMITVFHVRSFPDPGTGGWTEWIAPLQFTAFEPARYLRFAYDIREHIVAAPEKIQVKFAVQQFRSGSGSTPSPLYDNISVARYDAGGPAITVRERWLFNDAFPESGSIDFSSDPAALAVRIDQATSTQDEIVAGDSLNVMVEPVIPGTSLAGNPQLHARIFTNPLFDGVRTIPPEFSAIGSDASGWNAYQTSVVSDSTQTTTGTWLEHTFFADVPGDGPARTTPAGIPIEADEPALFFPGDVVHFFIRAEDNQGNVSTLPADTTGYAVRGEYNDQFVVRALPTLVSDGSGGVQQPRILAINDGGRFAGAELRQVLEQNGLLIGEHYDLYTVRSPTSGVANGIGSASHGGTAVQLAGYDCIVYTSGSSALFTLGDGIGNNVWADSSDDMQVLRDWQDLTGDRAILYFGSHLAQSLSNDFRGQAFLRDLLGAEFVGDDVSGAVIGQLSPVVAPDSGGGSIFTSSYVAEAPCREELHFDHVQPLAGASRSHEFLTEAGSSGTYAAAAGIWHERTRSIDGTDYRRVDALFPYTLDAVLDLPNVPGSGPSARAVLINEALTELGHDLASLTPTATSLPPVRFEVRGNTPNPFNPLTMLRLTAPARDHLRVDVYDIRGKHVATLWDSVVEAGAVEVPWDGRDARGRMVASGVYVYRARGFGEERAGKMALVR